MYFYQIVQIFWFLFIATKKDHCTRAKLLILYSCILGGYVCIEVIKHLALFIDETRVARFTRRPAPSTPSASVLHPTRRDGIPHGVLIGFGPPLPQSADYRLQSCLPPSPDFIVKATQSRGMIGGSCQKTYSVV